MHDFAYRKHRRSQGAQESILRKLGRSGRWEWLFSSFSLCFEGDD